MLKVPTGLTERQMLFYEESLQKFRENTDWLTFEAFVFGPMSPLYLDQKSHLDVLEEPLYQALKDMCLQLGVQQGMIKRNTAKE